MHRVAAFLYLAFLAFLLVIFAAGIFAIRAAEASPGVKLLAGLGLAACAWIALCSGSAIYSRYLH